MPPPNSTDSKTPAGRSTVPSSGIRRNSTPPCRVQSHQILPACRERWRVSLRFLGQLLGLALCAVEWAGIHFYGIKDPAPSEGKRPWAFPRSEGSPEGRGSAAEMNSGPLNRLKRHSQQPLQKRRHHGGRRPMNMLIEGRSGGFEVQLDGARTGCAGGLVEAGGGIDIPGGADGDEQVTALQCLGDARHVEGHLAEPHDMRAQVARGLAAAADGVEAEVLADIENQP